MYQLRIPGDPPVTNDRLKASRTQGHLHTTDAVKDYKEAAGLFAQAALRKAGVAEPLAGALCALYLVRIPNGRRDWDSSIKDVQDSLNGIAWKDDRQIKAAVGLIDNHASEAEVVVYFGRLEEFGTLATLADTLRRTLKD